MLKTIVTATALAIAASTLSTATFAADEKANPATMSHEAKPGVTEATGTGIINSIDAGKRQVNLKHDPIPDLGWPEMTMDLHVGKKVDLGTLKPGDKVSFHLKMGRDKSYRITKIEAVK